MRITHKFSYMAKGTGNLILEGDNIISLQMLKESHRAKVDCIYIDPPYNTGSRNFVYKDSFKKNDLSLEKSEWHLFMKARLELAYQTLKDTGVFFMSIDDRELASALMLLDSIFTKSNRIGIFTKEIKGGKNDSRFIKKSHEYLLVYGKTKLAASQLRGRKIQCKSVGEQPLNKWGDNDRRIDRPNLYYPIYVNEKTGKISTTKFPGSVEIRPIKSNGEDGCWRWQKSKVDTEKHKLVIKRKKNGEPWIYTRGDLTAEHREVPWSSIISNFGSGGGELIKEIFGDAKRFHYAKNLEFMKWIISLLKNKNAIVLDFFAGSGTTAHALFELNAEDGGSRKFILCGNSELDSWNQETNICREICATRVKWAIKKHANLFNADQAGFDYYEIDRNTRLARSAMLETIRSFAQIRLNLSSSDISPLTERLHEKFELIFCGTSRKGDAVFVSLASPKKDIPKSFKSDPNLRIQLVSLKNVLGDFYGSALFSCEAILEKEAVA